MTNKTFFIHFFLVLLFGFILRVFPLRNNNFYFTMDQGRTAVYIRDMIERQQIPLQGPQTSIEDFYNGPLWFWWRSIGYFIFQGHPINGPVMMIIVNLGLTAFVVWKISHRVLTKIALVVGLSLQLFWPFYDTSRYSFNPHPLVALAVLLVFWLVDFLDGKISMYLLAAIPVALTFHTELAVFPAFLIFYLFVGLWQCLQRKSSWAIFFQAGIIISMFFIPHLISELQTNFSQVIAIQKHLEHPSSFFAGSNFQRMTAVFLDLMTSSIIPQSQALSLGVFVVLLISAKHYLSGQGKTDVFIRRFVMLSFLLYAISWLFFGSNRGWHEWHTIYIPPLLFISIILLLFRLPRTQAVILFIIIMTSQLTLFVLRYREYFYPSADPSLLTNELKAIDWVYQQSSGKGFYVYSYLPSVYDYPYQYLFWWYGRKQFGYVPCEYSTYPNIPSFFVPGYQYYQEPKRGCANLRFLIVEPDEHQELREKWLAGARKGTILVKEFEVGKIHIEKRSIVSPSNVTM